MTCTRSDWKDGSVASVRSMRNGLSEAARTERGTLFGSNAIEIDARPIGQLLLDEVSLL